MRTQAASSGNLRAARSSRVGTDAGLSPEVMLSPGDLTISPGTDQVRVRASLFGSSITMSTSSSPAKPSLAMTPEQKQPEDEEPPRPTRLRAIAPDAHPNCDHG
jgi:hypothetical protein